MKSKTIFQYILSTSIIVLLSVFVRVTVDQLIHDNLSFAISLLPMSILMITSISIKNKNEVKFESKRLLTSLIYGLSIVISYSTISTKFLLMWAYLIMAVLLTCSLVLFILLHKENETISSNHKDTNKQNFSQNLFIIYFVNFSKTYELAMLINNKIKMTVEKEKVTSSSNTESEQFNFGVNNEGIPINISTQESVGSSSKKEEALRESFEIKNTKSKLLELVLNKAESITEFSDLTEGKIIKLDDVKMELFDKQNSEAIKMMMSGAFNGFNIRGQEQGLDYEMNLSSILNSFLSEYVYELNFSKNDRSYIITIPFTGNSQFENNYSVNDLLTGTVTVVGVYKGKYDRPVQFLDNMLKSKENQEPNTKQAENPVTVMNEADEFDTISFSTNTTEKPSEGESITHYIDVIAILQQVVIEGGANEEEAN